MIRLSYNGFVKTIKAVLFDMDGVVTDSMPWHWHYRCWREVLLKRGIEIDKQELYKREGEKGIAYLINNLSQKGYTFDRDEHRKILKEKEDLFQKTANIKLFDGIEDFIKRIVLKGSSVALVTGASVMELKRVLPEGVILEFDSIVTGDMLEKGKPEPDPYLKALADLKADKEHTVVIENSPLGIESAKKADIFTIAIETSLNSDFLKGADMIFPDHATLYKAFL